LVCVIFQTLFEEVIKTIDNGGKAARVTTSTTVGYTKEQAETIQRLVNAKDNYERLGLHYGASRWGTIINRTQYALPGRTSLWL
jgi:DnaJ family protein C protein 27